MARRKAKVEVSTRTVKTYDVDCSRCGPVSSWPTPEDAKTARETHEQIHAEQDAAAR